MPVNNSTNGSKGPHRHLEREDEDGNQTGDAGGEESQGSSLQGTATGLGARVGAAGGE